MPIYEYECTEGHRFEELQKISDAPLTKCKNCGKDVRKLISNTSFQLKGSGWYQDGYSSPKKLDATPTTSEATKSETPKESKPSEPSTKKGD